MKYYAAVFWMMTSGMAFGQRVQSGSFNMMLKVMLSHSVPECSVEQAAKYKNIQFLDARAKREYDVSHIDQALWVGYEDFDVNRLKEIGKDELIVVYCSVGYRSEKIAEKIKKLGFTKVFNLYGGIFEWVNQGHAVVSADKPTNKVHAYSKTFGVWLNKGEKVYE